MKKVSPGTPTTADKPIDPKSTESASTNPDEPTELASTELASTEFEPIDPKTIEYKSRLEGKMMQFMKIHDNPPMFLRLKDNGLNPGKYIMSVLELQRSFEFDIGIDSSTNTPENQPLFDQSPSQTQYKLCKKDNAEIVSEILLYFTRQLEQQTRRMFGEPYSLIKTETTMETIQTTIQTTIEALNKATDALNKDSKIEEALENIKNQTEKRNYVKLGLLAAAGLGVAVVAANWWFGWGLEQTIINKISEIISPTLSKPPLPIVGPISSNIQSSIPTVLEQFTAIGTETTPAEWGEIIFKLDPGLQTKMLDNIKHFYDFQVKVAEMILDSQRTISPGTSLQTTAQTITDLLPKLQDLGLQIKDGELIQTNLVEMFKNPQQVLDNAQGYLNLIGGATTCAGRTIGCVVQPGYWAQIVGGIYKYKVNNILAFTFEMMKLMGSLEPLPF